MGYGWGENILGVVRRPRKRIMGVRSAWAAACRREAVKNIVVVGEGGPSRISGSFVRGLFKGGLTEYFSARLTSGNSVVAGGRRKEGWRGEEEEEEEEKLRMKEEEIFEGRRLHNWGGGGRQALVVV